MKKCIPEQESTLIKAIRFPLIVMVVPIHVLPDIYEPVACGLSGENIYHFFSECISHNLAKMAVPFFFFISGYLFFANIQGNLTLEMTRSKWRRRAKSLLVPYICWNALLAAAFLIKNRIFDALGMEPDGGVEMMKDLGLYGIFWSKPLNFPLWYLRDLICMSLFAPAFYLYFKKLGLTGLVVLFVLYLTGLEIPFPGFSTTAFFYYGLGTFIGIKGKGFMQYVRNAGPACTAATLSALPVLTLLNTADIHEHMIRLCIPVIMISFAYLTSKAITRKKISDTLCKLSASVFFIYACHEVYILNWSKGLVLRMFGDSLTGMWMKYLIVPCLTLSACYALYLFMKKFFPRTLAVICGQRE